MPETKKKIIAKASKTVKSVKSAKDVKVVIATEIDLRSYELVVIVSSKVKADKRGEIIAKLSQSAVDLGGKSTKTEELGLKDLAYSIKHELSGWYALLNLSLPAEAVKKMDDIVKREEKIIRYLLVSAKDGSASGRKN